jgi:hypothetical protein
MISFKLRLSQFFNVPNDFQKLFLERLPFNFSPRHKFKMAAVADKTRPPTALRRGQRVFGDLRHALTGRVRCTNPKARDDLPLTCCRAIVNRLSVTLNQLEIQSRKSDDDFV